MGFDPEVKEIRVMSFNNKTSDEKDPLRRRNAVGNIQMVYMVFGFPTTEGVVAASTLCTTTHYYVAKPSNQSMINGCYRFFFAEKKNKKLWFLSSLLNNGFLSHFCVL